MKETLADITEAWSDLGWKPKVDIFDWLRGQI